jgi:hypothetical protein
MKTMNQELAREACGLWICTISFMICWEIDRFSSKQLSVTAGGVPLIS